ncbi:hypothetical protein ACWEWX_22250, partial [Streptomyces asiaticus]
MRSSRWRTGRGAATRQPRGHHGRRHRPADALILDQEVPVRFLASADDHPVPAYSEPRSAGSVPPLSGIDPAGATAIVEEFLTRHPDGGWPDPRGRAALLDRYRIPQLPWAWAEDEDTAVTAARHLVEDERGRVAVKAYWPGLVCPTSTRQWPGPTESSPWTSGCASCHATPTTPACGDSVLPGSGGPEPPRWHARSHPLGHDHDRGTAAGSAAALVSRPANVRY